MSESISQVAYPHCEDKIRQVKHRKKWQYHETAKYCQFIQKYRQTLQFEQKKLKQRIYNKMSQYIGSRSTHQCRSHHQKIIKRYNTIEQFIKVFKSKGTSFKEGFADEKKHLQAQKDEKKAIRQMNIDKISLIHQEPPVQKIQLLVDQYKKNNILLNQQQKLLYSQINKAEPNALKNIKEVEQRKNIQKSKVLRPIQIVRFESSIVNPVCTFPMTGSIREQSNSSNEIKNNFRRTIILNDNSGKNNLSNQKNMSESYFNHRLLNHTMMRENLYASNRSQMNEQNMAPSSQQKYIKQNFIDQDYSSLDQKGLIEKLRNDLNSRMKMTQKIFKFILFQKNENQLVNALKNQKYITETKDAIQMHLQRQPYFHTWNPQDQWSQSESEQSESKGLELSQLPGRSSQSPITFFHEQYRKPTYNMNPYQNKRIVPHLLNPSCKVQNQPPYLNYYGLDIIRSSIYRSPNSYTGNQIDIQKDILYLKTKDVDPTKHQVNIVDSQKQKYFFKKECSSIQIYKQNQLKELKPNNKYDNEDDYLYKKTGDGEHD